MPAKFKPVSERYEVAENGCWLWLGATTGDGYGYFKVNHERILAHRYFYERHHATRIPPGKVLDHLCNRRRCINPSHMQVTTHRENILRSPHTITGINSRKTECKRGHPLTDNNTYASTPHKRACRTCAQLRAKEQRDRNYSMYYNNYNSLLNKEH